jgi:hypothetical protein
MQVQTRDIDVAGTHPARTRNPLDAIDATIDRHPAAGLVLALVVIVVLGALVSYCGLPR